MGIKKAIKACQAPVPGAHGKKLTAFFSMKQVAGGEVEVRAAAPPTPASRMCMCPPTAALLPMALSWFENCNPSSYVFYLCAPQYIAMASASVQPRPRPQPRLSLIAAATAAAQQQQQHSSSNSSSSNSSGCGSIFVHLGGV